VRQRTSGHRPRAAEAWQWRAGRMGNLFAHAVNVTRPEMATPRHSEHSPKGVVEESILNRSLHCAFGSSRDDNPAPCHCAEPFDLAQDRLRDKAISTVHKLKIATATFCGLATTLTLTRLPSPPYSGHFPLASPLPHVISSNCNCEKAQSCTRERRYETKIMFVEPKRGCQTTLT
jgi:hypothetical protein